MKRAFSLLVVAGLALLLVVTRGLQAQEDETACAGLVVAALEAAAESCAGTGRNEVCYGNVRLQAEPQPGIDTLVFEQQGDIAEVAAIRTLTLSSLDEETEEWGVALMRLQANLPDSLPGQNITLLLFGDVAVENAVEPGAAPVLIDITARAGLNVRGGPSTSAPVIGALAGGEVVVATGRLADGSWLRIEQRDGVVGWVFADLVSSDGDLSALAVVEAGEEPEAAFAPMQAFYFSSGLDDAPCEGAPDSGILIQTPEGVGEVMLRVNEVNITLSSTVYLQAQAPGQMTITGIENQAEVAALDEAQTALAGTRVTVPLNEDSAPSGPPEPPQPYDYDSLQALPLSYLDRPLDLPAAQTQAQAQAAPGGGQPVTPTPGGSSTQTFTDAPGGGQPVTPTPGGSSTQTFTDAPGDAQGCGDGMAVDDPEVDIAQVGVSRSPDGDFNAIVYLDQPLQSDYSFSVLLALFYQNQADAYLWEIHDTQYRIGAMDMGTGEIIPGDVGGANIMQAGRTVTFNLPAGALPAEIDQIGVRSFHTPDADTEPQPAHCDTAGPYRLPDALR